MDSRFTLFTAAMGAPAWFIISNKSARLSGLSRFFLLLGYWLAVNKRCSFAQPAIKPLTCGWFSLTLTTMLCSKGGIRTRDLVVMSHPSWPTALPCKPFNGNSPSVFFFRYHISVCCFRPLLCVSLFTCPGCQALAVPLCFTAVRIPFKKNITGKNSRSSRWVGCAGTGVEP